MPEIADAVGPDLRIGIFGPGADTLASRIHVDGYRVVGINSDVPWGQASTELVKLVYDPGVIGIVAVGREPSHLAEQIAVKTFIPVVAISSDQALTSTNIPWIFRVDPSTPVEDALRCLTGAAERAGPEPSPHPRRSRFRPTRGRQVRLRLQGRVEVKMRYFSAAAILACLLLPPSPLTAQAPSNSVDYPSDHSLFPPDLTPPTFLWRDSSAGRQDVAHSHRVSPTARRFSSLHRSVDARGGRG